MLRCNVLPVKSKRRAQADPKLLCGQLQAELAKEIALSAKLLNRT